MDNQSNLLWIVIGLAVALLLGGMFLFMQSAKSDMDKSPVASEAVGEAASSTEIGTTQQETPGETTTMASGSDRNAIQDAPNPVVVVETTMGTFKIELYTNLVPITAGNFSKLVEQKFYDGLIFHRVIYEVPATDTRPAFKFVIQAGDPFCTNGEGECGEGGPGWTIPLEIVPQLRHSEAGMVAMARSEDPDSAGSQFYITLGPLAFLDDNYAVFGKVIEGLDVVMAIGQAPTNEDDRPLEDVVMQKVYLQN